MYFHVIPLRERGKPRDKKELQQAKPVAGDLRIEYQHTSEMGRPGRVAFICNGAPDDGPLGLLFDAEVHSMAPNGFVVTGVELIDGVAYGQSWLCRERARRPDGT